MTAGVFVTATGVEVPAVTADQMREIDRVAIEDMGPNLHQMMENAGRSLALTVAEWLGGGWASAPIVVLAGTGGNGGGGICAARHLANRGVDVTLVVSDPARLSSVPEEQLQTFHGTAGTLATVEDLDGLLPAVVVDAIIGYNLGGAPRGAAAGMIEWTGSLPAPVISLDVPSGIDVTTGDAPGLHVQAASTLTLALPKLGLDGAATGDLWLADIGITAGVYRRVGLQVSPAVFGPDYRVAIQPI